ncbi:hypothetical protein N4G70_29285 [Streptomyces sp. ASQP_92]|uniref:hypothetical protein n=1 Tax=Streptomyces sp. ASQP_92 TaxID=2979116 RepID=UPI0021C24CC1|nr:hypothetical protein [Streptomyces sp. ASQP_92]MCT9092935.1 hypothetical protein [Streptomyces sp. ASQP_92]
MDQRNTPTPLITKAELMAWLKVSNFWVRDRMKKDPHFVERCVVDLAPDGSDRQTLRFVVDATAAHLGIPRPSEAVKSAA